MARRLTGRVLLEQFRVDAFIAAGGMGAVYKVWDLKRQVPLAMKVLHAELAEDPSIFKRFKREANALKKLAHPNIVPFYGLYRTLDLAFLLEGFVDGPTLKDVLKQKEHLSAEEALIVLKGISAALSYAHTHGVVHCDVKPGNVMVDSGGRIYLTDFGIARHAESTTTTFGFAGTAAYMAPEQIRGEPVTPATDVYSLGVMAYELLVGRRPFTGEEEGTGSTQTRAERLRMAHLKSAPPDPRQFNAEIPEKAAQVLLKALAKAPEERYRDAWAFFEALCGAYDKATTEVRDRLSGFIWEDFEDEGNNPPATKGEVVVAAAAGTPEGKRTFSLRGQPLWVGILVGVLLVGMLMAGVALGKRETASVRGKTVTDVLQIARGGQTRANSPTGNVGAMGNEATITPTGTRVATLTPTVVPTSTPTLTLTPTAYVAGISARNVDRLVEVKTIHGHNGWVWNLAFSPDGSLLASASADDTVKVWRVGDWRRVHTMYHDADAMGVAFSPQNRYLASVSLDGTVRIWRVGSWDLVKEIYHRAKVYKVAFSPDGQYLVFGAANRRAEVWKVSEWSRLFTLYHSNDVFCLAISPDSQWLATGERHGAVRIWRLSDGEKVATLWHRGDINGLAFSPKGDLLASASDDGTIKIWSVGDWVRVRTMHQGSEAFSVAFSPDGSLIASGSGGSTITLWRVADGSLLRTLSVPAQRIWSVAFSPHGRWLASRSNVGDIQIWEVP